MLQYLNGGNWELIEEVLEVESGRSCDRPQLARALDLCLAHRAALVVANVSRLTRSSGFLAKLLEAGVEICFVDLPSVAGPTGRFLLQQMASVAELEAGLISKRTKDALAAAKARGVALGGFRGRAGTNEDCAKGRAARTSKALRHAKAIGPMLARYAAEGVASHAAVAARLNAENVPTPSGRGVWAPTTVARLRAKA